MHGAEFFTSTYHYLILITCNFCCTDTYLTST
uniref:Uncharacterized protein n=1 Tax=Myoviridae sp. ctZgq1 TaxID=2826666 RepID=A0A8S5LXG6_9CAUD|nr:MAG TPA: hypothetical protein [Myoviridae sp. ctZgq1]